MIPTSETMPEIPTVSVPAIAPGLAGAIGRTPLIRLGRLSDATGCEILGKAGFMNPGRMRDRFL